MRVSYETFQYLCSKLAPSLQKQDTRLRSAIPLEIRVAVGLSRLATGSTLQVVADLYSIGLSTCHMIFVQFLTSLNSLKGNYVRWPSSSRMREIALDFERLHGIPNVVGAIDGSHIPIVAPHLHAADYFNRKGFHSVLLQGVVTSDCIFWDFDIGWSGSMHDSNLWARSALGHFCEVRRLSPFALIGDAAYPPRPWMLSPYKGHKDGLSHEQSHWNFIQSSTRMCIERSFGILKGRWRILLKRMDCDLRMVSDIVTACIILHNLCNIHKDEFNNKWIEEAKEDIHDYLRSDFMQKYTGRLQMSQDCLDSLEGFDRNALDSLQRMQDIMNSEYIQMMSKENKTSKELASRRDAIAKSLFNAKKCRVAGSVDTDGDK